VARLYANENFPMPVVEALRQMGHDVLTTRETGRANAQIPDSEVLAFAISEDRAVLTLNRRDFIKLHKVSPDHRGVIVCTFDNDFSGQAQRIHAAIQEGQQDLWGKLIRINRPSM
jgi:predicted nuclease of predicted toxin-antitoxin system